MFSLNPKSNIFYRPGKGDPRLILLDLNNQRRITIWNAGLVVMSSYNTNGCGFVLYTANIDDLSIYNLFKHNDLGNRIIPLEVVPGKEEELQQTLVSIFNRIENLNVFL